MSHRASDFESTTGGLNGWMRFIVKSGRTFRDNMSRYVLKLPLMLRRNIEQKMYVFSKRKLILIGKTHPFSGKLSLNALVQTLTNILEDDSSVAVRLSLTALQMCINQVLESSQCSLGLSVMLQLFQLKHNPYWLVKVYIGAEVGD